MSQTTAIRIENLGKRYRYGGPAAVSYNLRQDLMDWAKGLVRRQSRVGRDAVPGNTGVRSQNQPTIAAHHPTLHEVQEKHLAEDPNYFWALRDINLEIKQGEVVGIIGRNGAGKSTLLKILSRITPPTTGSITYNGRMASLLEVGTGFHRELTGRENIFLNGSILGMKRSEITKKFDEIVAFAEVEKFIDTPVKFYSSGMYVRLAFAVAAHLEPEILVVDEVLAVGDAEFQKKCLGKMGEVAKQGRTILFVSHNMGAVSELCNRAVRLDQGVLNQDGLPSDIVADYLRADSETGIVDLRAWTIERTGRGPMRFAEVRTFGVNTEVQSTFGWKESFALRLLIESDRQRDAIIRIGIRDATGNMVLNFCNLDDGMQLTFPRGQITVDVIPEVHWLNDGEYFVSVQVDDGTAILHDRVGNCIKFSIDSRIQGISRSTGLFRIPVRWKSSEKLEIPTLNTAL